MGKERRAGGKMCKEGFVPRTSPVNGMPFNQGATGEHFCHSGSIYNSTLWQLWQVEKADLIWGKWITGCQTLIWDWMRQECGWLNSAPQQNEVFFVCFFGGGKHRTPDRTELGREIRPPNWQMLQRTVHWLLHFLSVWNEVLWWHLWLSGKARQ